MFIKYGDLDVTHRLIEYKSSVAFADGYIIGNVPTMQLNLITMMVFLMILTLIHIGKCKKMKIVK